MTIISYFFQNNIAIFFHICYISVANSLSARGNKMPCKVAVSSMCATKKEERLVKVCKYNLIDKLNFSGVQYPLVKFLSSILNTAINNFNTNKTTYSSLDENLKVISFDIVTLEKYSSLFILDLKESKISLSIISYFEKIIEQLVNIIDDNLKK